MRPTTRSQLPNKLPPKQPMTFVSAIIHAQRPWPPSASIWQVQNSLPASLRSLEIRGSSCRLTTMTRTVKWDYIIRVIFLEFCTILSKPCGRWTEAAWSDQDRSFVVVVQSATPSLRKEPNISVPLGCVVIKKDGWWRCGCHSWSEVKRRMRDENWGHLLCGRRGLAICNASSKV